MYGDWLYFLRLGNIPYVLYSYLSLGHVYARSRNNTLITHIGITASLVR